MNRFIRASMLATAFLGTTLALFGRAAQAGLSTSYSYDGTSFGYSTNSYASGQPGYTTYDFNGYFETPTGAVNTVMLNDSSVPGSDTVDVFMYFEGTAGDPPNDTPVESQQTSITLGAQTTYEYVGTSFYDASDSGGKGALPVTTLAANPTSSVITPAEWIAVGSADLSLTLSGVTSITANASYSEFINGGLTDTSWIPAWTITFDSPSDETLGVSDLVSLSTSIPEPGSLALFALGSFLSFRRRIRRGR